MGGFSHPFGVRQERHPKRRDKRLEAQKLLQRLLVRLRAPFRMKANLVDADCIRSIVRPEVGVDLEPRRLTRAEQQLLGEGARHSGFANAFLPDQAVGMREPTSIPMGPENADRAFMARYRRKAAHHGGGRSRAARSGCWHRRPP